MNTKNLLFGLSLLGTFSTQAAVMIDVDLATPGVQNSITNAQEGDVIEIALVVTGFTDFNPCMNGIGGDISARGSMSVAFDSMVYAGTIADYTNEGFARSPLSGSLLRTSGSPIGSVGLPPLPGYTSNVGGAGLIDPWMNLNGDNQLFSFLNTPASAETYATIFRTSITVTNVANMSLELFPSGVFDNPDTRVENGETALDGIFSGFFSGPGSYPPNFVQGGDFNLHTEFHDLQPCMGSGSDIIMGATISGSGVPEPSSALLTGIFSLLLLMRRSRA